MGKISLKKQKEKKEKVPKAKKEKVPKAKKEKKGKEAKGKKKEKIKSGKPKKRPVFLLIILFIILAAMAFLMFGGNLVPKQIQSLGGYTYIVKASDRVRETIPNPLEAFFGAKKSPDQETMTADLTDYLSGKEETVTIDKLGTEKQVKSKKTELVYVKVDLTVAKAKAEGEASKAEVPAETRYYQLEYKLGLTGKWKLKNVTQYNVEGETVSVAGVPNDIVEGDTAFSELPQDWKARDIKVEAHFYDAKAGTDTVLVSMKVLTGQVQMEGTREAVYQYNGKTEQWELSVPPTKLSVTYLEPMI